MTKTIRYGLLIALSGLLACQFNQPNIVQEPLPLPKKNADTTFCTMQYAPVCARIQINGKTQLKTFSNRCVLGSASVQVVRVTKGECKQ